MSDANSVLLVVAWILLIIGGVAVVLRESSKIPVVDHVKSVSNKKDE